jgi:signal transduction histidine kinase
MSSASDITIDFLSGGGEVGDLIRQFDWSRTAMGPLGSWPPGVVTAVSMVLGSPVAMALLWGEDGIMIYNDGHARIAGGRHPDMLGQPVRAAWPEVSGFNDRVMRMVLAGGVLSYHDQQMTIQRFGTPEQVWFDLDYSPVLNERGVPVAVLAVVVETTARVMAERQLRRKVEEHAEALARARKMEVIGRLTDGIAHDFNNLLTAVLGNLEMLSHRLGEDARASRLVQNATQAARRGASLTRRMQGFALTRETRLAELDVAKLVEGMDELFARALGPMLSIEIRLEPDLPRIESDAHQLETMLLDLMLNARDAVDGMGEIGLAVSKSRPPAELAGHFPGEALCIAVESPGREPGEAWDGLGQVQSLAEGLGGRLRIHHPAGRSACAEVWLPLQQPGHEASRRTGS